MCLLKRGRNGWGKEGIVEEIEEKLLSERE